LTYPRRSRGYGDEPRERTANDPDVVIGEDQPFVRIRCVSLKHLGEEVELGTWTVVEIPSMQNWRLMG
jgi:hypothetical protein